MIASDLQPDQLSSQWSDHVLVYETVFEPFSIRFADAAIAALGRVENMRCLDVGCGSGGGALRLAAIGAEASAIDASASMIERVNARAKMANVSISAHVMDGQHLGYADGVFDAAISVFGVILFPDAAAGMRELRRVVRPGGKVAVVTWTQPQNYQLSAELRAAVGAVLPDAPASALPAQLRFREEADFRTLFAMSGFRDVKISTHTAAIVAPSARWLADHLAFAPGMSAMLKNLGSHAPAVLERFVVQLEERQGLGQISLDGVAFVGVATA